MINNSTKLIAFILKRDRLWLSSWMLCVIVIAVGFAPMLPAMAGTADEISILAETMKNPAMIALTGPVYGEEYTYGIMFIQMLLVWTMILIAIMNIFFVVRHTRKDEEDGRVELLRALPIGRASGFFSLSIIAICANIVIAIICGFSLAAFKIEGMDFTGCMLFGFAIGFCGIFFAAITMLFAQLSSSSKGTTG